MRPTRLIAWLSTSSSVVLAFSSMACTLGAPQPGCTSSMTLRRKRAPLTNMGALRFSNTWRLTGMGSTRERTWLSSELPVSLLR
jgi:hypothetical protein